MVARSTLLGALAAAALMADPASAGLFRAYLSLQGDDGNPCTLQQPCRHLPAALAVINDGGEIWMVDSATYNTASVEVTKSATLLAIPGVLGTVVATGGSALRVNAAGAKVTLRNLRVTHLSLGVHGVEFAQGAEVTIEECEIAGMPLSGVFVSAANSAVTIKNTTIRDNDTGVNVQGSTTALLDGVMLSSNSSFGLYALSGPKVNIRSSVIANHAAGGIAGGIHVLSLSGQRTQVVVEQSVLRNNTRAAFSETFGTGSSVEVSLRRNVISHNTTGYGASAAAGTVITALLDANTVSYNTTGVSIGASVVNTRQNNTFQFNSTNVSGGSLTALSAF